jgi:PAS domain S-box-containing protein
MRGGPAPRIARGASTVVIAIGSAVLAGWAFDIGTLKTVLPGFVSMKANTAACFILSGLALRLQVDLDPSPSRRRWSRSLAAVVGFVGIATLCQHLLDVDIGIDQLLATAPPHEAGAARPGRMSPPSAASFVVLAIVFAILSRKERAYRSTVQVLTVGVLLNAILAGVGYAAGVRALYGLGSYTAQAVHTAFSFAVMSLGILAARSRARPLRFLDWPLRAKMATLLAVSSIAPLAISALTDIRAASTQLLDEANAVLSARGDQLLWEIDGFNRTHLRSVEHLAAATATVEQAPAISTEEKAVLQRALLATRLAVDPDVRAVAILDASGAVVMATDPALEKADLSTSRYVREALRRQGATISDIHVVTRDTGEEANVAYLAPLARKGEAPSAIAVVWIRAAALWALMKRANELAGAGSFAVMFDEEGIRIAHTYSDEALFHPGGELSPGSIGAALAENRFGMRTRALLNEVRPFPEQFRRALAPSVDRAIFYGFAPVNQQWNYGVARRLSTAPWTVFYMLPENPVRARIALLARQKAIFAAVVILTALVAGTMFSVVITSPVRHLSQATERFAGGDTAARALTLRDDELGQLAEAFNRMAERIELQARGLQRSNDELEERVKRRTAQLAASEHSLAITLRSIEQSEARKTAILDSAFDAIVTMDHRGLLVEFNPAAEKLFGYTRADVIGRTMVDRIVPPSQREAHARGFARYLATGEGPVLGRVIELPAMRSDGTEFPAELAINRVKGDLEPLFTAFIRDITERRRMEEDVRANQKRFRALVDASAQIVWTATAAGDVVDESPSWCAFTGQTKEDYLDPARRSSAIHPDDLLGVRSAWMEAAREKRQFSGEYRLRHASGDWRWATYRVVPLIDEKGDLKEWVGMNVDITAEKMSLLEREHLLYELKSLNAELEQRVESRTAELSAALKEREVLLQEVHHRVKNNLQVISSLINIQMRQMSDQRARAALEECRTRIAAIALIHEKLYQTKDYASVPFSEYARNLAANIFHATGISPSSIVLKVDIERILLPVDKAIPCGLILNELITNALKHAFPDNRSGSIHVELRASGGRMLLAVEDDGIGMPAGFDTTRSKSLGMQLVSTLVRQLDGELSTIREHGTSFRITFPLEAAS